MAHNKGTETDRWDEAVAVLADELLRNFPSDKEVVREVMLLSIDANNGESIEVVESELDTPTDFGKLPTLSVSITLSYDELTMDVRQAVDTVAERRCKERMEKNPSFREMIESGPPSQEEPDDA